MMGVRLCKNFRIGQMELKNRMVMPPMLTQYADEKGYVTERTKNHYEARARGGAGLIIVESCYVHRDAQVFENMLGISDDKFIAGMRELVQVVHRHGAKIAIQLEHGGKASMARPVVPSPLPDSGGKGLKVLTVEEIAGIVACFADAAIRAKKAGFDGAEIHGAHGYILAQFLSRSSNKRQDIYGGNLENRARLLIEVIKAVRAAVGVDYPVWCRINGREYGVDEGITLEEAQETARMIQEVGADAIHVSAFAPGSPGNDPIFFKVVDSLDSPVFTPAIITDLAEGVKKAVTVPVIATGRMTPEAGERILAEGKADLISIGKGLLADPELPNKVCAGKWDDIKPCILCLSCRNDLFSNIPGVVGIRCRVNPALGKEVEYKIISTTKKPRKILIVGGGPAGMEAARVAALRGHQVILCEKEAKLGGQLNQAAIPPYKDGIKDLNEYLQEQLVRLGVQVAIGEELSTKRVEEIKPDKIIVATGASPIIPNISGVNRESVVTALEALSGEKELGEEVIIVGGGRIGCETAEFLADSGKNVTILVRRDQIGANILSIMRPFIIQRLEKAGVMIKTKTQVVEITDKGVTTVQDGASTEFFEGDTVVLALGMKSETNFAQNLQFRLAAVYPVGDCVEPRTIHEAMVEGYLIGLEM